MKLSTTKEIDMKNADMPAMPIVDADATPMSHQELSDWRDNSCLGLTKREMMAMHAPDDIPTWFEELWEKNNWNDGELYEDWTDEYEIDHRSITPTGSSRMYFEWRAHYADALLAELEKQQ